MSGLFFPFSFLGLTLFYLIVIYERTTRLINVVSTFLWLVSMLALISSSPPMYHLFVCLFFMIQSLHYGFRSSHWFVQTATLISFFSFLVGIFMPQGIYIGVCTLILELLCVRPFGRVVEKESTHE
ncbi:MAG: hypothetical protein ACRC9L_08795 [Brevinema sp.]